MNIFIMPAGKNTGKTVITAGLAALMQSLGYFSGVFKPVQTGAIEKNGFLISKDTAFITQTDPYIKIESPYIFKEKGIPEEVAKNAGDPILLETLLKSYVKLSQNCDVIFVDFDGNFLTPISEEINVAELIKSLSASVVIVTDVNSFEETAMIAECAKNRHIEVKGIIINNYPEKPDKYAKLYPVFLAENLQLPILGIVKKIKSTTASGLIDTILSSVNLEGVFGMEIPKLRDDN